MSDRHGDDPNHVSSSDPVHEPGLRREKNLLRKELRRRLASMDAEVRGVKSKCIRTHLLRTDAWTSSETLFAFLPLPVEPDADPIIEEALSRGKIVAVPRMAGSGISFRRIFSIDGPWQVHPYGVREPGRDTEITDAIELSSHADLLILVPGLAFDRQGNRLGRGKAYYDRFLAPLSLRELKSSRIHIVGCCFSEQIVKRVPTGPTDVAVDALVSDEGYITRRNTRLI